MTPEFITYLRVYRRALVDYPNRKVEIIDHYGLSAINPHSFSQFEIEFPPIHREEQNLVEHPKHENDQDQERALDTFFEFLKRTKIAGLSKTELFELYRDVWVEVVKSGHPYTIERLINVVLVMEGMGFSPSSIAIQDAILDRYDVDLNSTLLSLVWYRPQLTQLPPFKLLKKFLSADFEGGETGRNTIGYLRLFQQLIDGKRSNDPRKLALRDASFIIDNNARRHALSKISDTIDPLSISNY